MVEEAARALHPKDLETVGPYPLSRYEGGSMRHTPRWRHNCPGCGRVIFWERIYCANCIKEHPTRKRFKLTGLMRPTRRLSPRYGLLHGAELSRRHLFAIVKTHAVCVECGHKTHLNDLRHRCYFLREGTTRTMRSIRCKICHLKKAKHLFPVVKREGRVLRARVCSDCLHGSVVLPVKKRKYERKAVTT